MTFTGVLVSSVLTVKSGAGSPTLRLPLRASVHIVSKGKRKYATRATAAEVLAVRLWVVPAESVLVVNDATPFERAAVPMVVVPSRKLMLPEGTLTAEEIV